MGTFARVWVSVALLATACTPASTDATSTTAPAAATTSTSVAVTTTVSSPDTTTTVAPTPTVPEGPFEVVPEELSLFPPPSFTPTGAAGSGCEPGTEELPDGLWFGFVLGVSEFTVEFDLACFYFGDIAWDVAAEEGEEANNDFWIVNESNRIRILEYPAGTTVWTLGPNPTQGHLPSLLFTEWPVDPAYLSCPGEHCGVWLYINDGVVTELVEQYVP